jgi:diguanylate cyclase (GGDEF)-like protein
MFLIKHGISILDWAVRAGAILAVIIGLADLALWLLHAPQPTLLQSGLASNRLDSGLGFAAAGSALFLLHRFAPETPPFRLGRALAVAAAMLGGAALARDLSTVRTVPAIECALLFSGVALFVLKSRDPRVAVCCQWLTLPPLALAMLGVVGYAYGVPALCALMAPQAALALFALALGTLGADSTHGFVRIAAGDTAGGVVARRLLSVVPAAIFVLGWAAMRGEAAALFGWPFAVVSLVLAAVAISAAAIVATASALHGTDLVRKEAMARIRDLNARHERQIDERNEQLAKSLEELAEANKQLERLSQHDGLTGVANRRYFDNYLDTQIAVARRHNRTVSLVLCDVDAFKAYNDHYGHQAGDRILKQVAEAIQSSSKRTADIVARYGGEEFAIILPETALKGAMRVAEAARLAVTQLKIPHAHSPAGPHVSISGGVATTLWQGEDTAQQLIKAADQRLYEAKRQGRNRMIAAQPAAA